MHDKNPFDELENKLDDNADEKEEMKAEKEKRERSKFFLVKVESIFETQKELREYLEANPDALGEFRLVKGLEVLPQKKVTYVI